jgi:DNA-directed RNA polymerase specialized sigma24 family protein
MTGKICDLAILDERFVDFTDGHISRHELESDIFSCVIENYQVFGITCKRRDEVIDFYAWAYQRLSGAINRYEDVGANFSSYIYGILRYSFKEYSRVSAAHSNIEKSTWEEIAMQAVSDGHTNYSTGTNDYDEDECENVLAEFKLNNKAIENLKRNPRQILILLLKSYYFISERLMQKVAEITHVPIERIAALVQEVRELRVKQDEKVVKIEERLTTEFHHCMFYKKRLQDGTNSEEICASAAISLERCERRIAKLRERLANINLSATNRQIADVLGIAKGTVDSSVYNAKKNYILYD